MEEQTSWRSQTFTLMIFGGIVVLCAIFFVLGMLVGRTQSVKIGAVATADAASKPPVKEIPREEPPEPAFEPSPAKPAPAPPPIIAAATAPLEKEEAPVAREPVSINVQVVALKKQSDAERVVDDLKKKGIRAFMLTPTPDDANPYYRVQVGAADSVVAESIKQKLEAAGFKPIIKK
jgi:cell division septation protein DedD